MGAEVTFGALLLGSLLGWLAARWPRSPSRPGPAAAPPPPPELGRACVEAELAERHRIAARLHDQLQPLLAAADLQLDLPDGLSAARAALRAAAAIIRGLAHELGDPELELGLDAGLRRLCASVGAQLHMPVELRLGTRLSPPLPPPLHSLALMCARELLQNAHRHAKGEGVALSLEVGEAWLLLHVSDQGPGFAAGSGPALGLQGMRRRLVALGGELDIGDAPQGGARVTLCLPLRPDASPGLR